MKIDDVANIQMSKLIHLCGGIIIDVDRFPREASDRNGKLIDKMSAIR
jgi:hypothetical protein